MWFFKSFAVPLLRLLHVVIGLPFQPPLQSNPLAVISQPAKEAVVKDATPLLLRAAAISRSIFTSVSNLAAARWVELGLPTVPTPSVDMLSDDALAKLERAGTAWTAFARGNSPRDKLWATSLGYFVTAISLGFILESSGPNLGTAARLARSVLRQQVIVLKVRVR